MPFKSIRIASRRICLGAGLVVALVAPALTARQPPPDASAVNEPVQVQAIKNEIRRYANERVLLEGVVPQYEPTPTSSTRLYWLKDDWGGLILVRTLDELPQTGARYAIEGVVTLDDTRGGQPVIQEALRRALLEEGGPGAGDVEPAPDSSLPMELILIAAVLSFVGLLGVLIWVIRARSQDEEMPVTPLPGSFSTPVPLSASPPPTAPVAGVDGVLESKTIKIQTPPPDTLKMLPGYLEVLEGDGEVNEIRLFFPPNASTPEITFGRAEGREYGHVQLKPPTVSKRQAAIVFEEGVFRLVNYSDVNPTRVDSAPLGVNESKDLEDEALIEMGEIRFRFHAN